MDQENWSCFIACLLLLALSQSFSVFAGFAIGSALGWPAGVTVTLVFNSGTYVCVDIMAITSLRMTLRDAVSTMILRRRKS